MGAQVTNADDALRLALDEVLALEEERKAAYDRMLERLRDTQAPLAQEGE